MNIGDTSGTIVKEITIRSSASRIFDALTDPSQRLEWWARSDRFRAVHVESDLRPGGKWLMHFDSNGSAATLSGEYRVVDRPFVLEFTWQPSWDADSGTTTVRFDLIEHDDVTTVRVTHSGFTAEASHARHSGWPDLLHALRSYVETGAA